MTVWILFAFLYGFNGQPIIVVQDIATQRDCLHTAEVLGADLAATYGKAGVTFHCIAVRKAK